MKKLILSVVLFSVVLPLSARLNTLRGNRTERVFYLTIDAHNDVRNLDHALGVLDRHQVRATFFLTGYFIKKFPDAARRIARSGHVVGNHTFFHRRRYSPAQLLFELGRTEALYAVVTGARMERLWRAPYLQHMGRHWILRGPHARGYRHVDVTLTTRDWEKPWSVRYLSNTVFLREFRRGLDFRRYRQMVVCGRSILWQRNRACGVRLDYRGIIMLYHLGSFRSGNRDAILTMGPVLDTLRKKGYRFSTCLDFLPGRQNRKRI